MFGPLYRDRCCENTFSTISLLILDAITGCFNLTVAYSTNFRKPVISSEYHHEFPSTLFFFFLVFDSLSIG